MDDRIIYGPALIPDLKIYRGPNKVVDKPHHVLFTKETIEKIRTKFHSKHYDNNVKIRHGGPETQNVKMIHSFLLNETNRQSVPIEFQDLPDGTWMIAYKVEDDQIWRMIKDKKLNGFSIEGVFDYVL